MVLCIVNTTFSCDGESWITDTDVNESIGRVDIVLGSSDNQALVRLRALFLFLWVYGRVGWV